MVRFVREGGACALALGLATAALSAGHATQATASDFGGKVDVSFRTLDLTLQGRIKDSCEVTGGTTIDFGDNLSGGLSIPATLGLVCNTPFKLTVASTEGGLVHRTLPRGQGPFAGTLAYTMDVMVPTRIAGGAGTPLTGTVLSSDSPRTLPSASDAIAAGGGTIRFTTLTPAGAGLLAGDYSDTVIITVTAQ